MIWIGSVSVEHDETSPAAPALAAHARDGKKTAASVNAASRKQNVLPLLKRPNGATSPDFSLIISFPRSSKEWEELWRILHRRVSRKYADHFITAPSPGIVKRVSERAYLLSRQDVRRGALHAPVVARSFPPSEVHGGPQVPRAGGRNRASRKSESARTFR
jgi:hypothetical protein